MGGNHCQEKNNAAIGSLTAAQKTVRCQVLQTEQTPGHLCDPKLKGTTMSIIGLLLVVSILLLLLIQDYETYYYPDPK